LHRAAARPERSVDPGIAPPSIAPFAALVIRPASVTAIMLIGRWSALPSPRARLGREITNQSRAVVGLALGSLDQFGVVRDEWQVEQLGISLLLRIDPLLLVALERGRLLRGVENLAGDEFLIEDVEGVDVEMSVGR